jgi:hypothetical protein
MIMTYIADEVIRLLSPVIGAGLASSAVSMQCKNLGILPEQLSSQNISDIAARIEKVLQVFAGDQVASDVRQKIMELQNRSA